MFSFLSLGILGHPWASVGGCRQELFHTLGDPSLPALFDLSRSFVDLRLGTGSNSAPIWFDEF